MKKKNIELQKQLTQAQSPEFIEKQAREKLNLQKEGEIVVVLPKDLKIEQASVVQPQSEPNWQRWWKLIIN